MFWGYIPSRTVLDANIKYQYDKHITYTVSFANLLNTKYIYSSRSEDVLVPGTPINVRATIAYKF